MTADIYINILEEIMLPYEDFMLLLYVKHGASKAKRWSHNKVGLPSTISTFKFDENFWKIVKVKVAKQKPRNKKDLWELVKTAWYARN